MMSGCFSRATAPVSSLWAASLVWSASLLGPAAAPASRPTAAMVTATIVRAAGDRDVVEKRINRELPREERCPAPRRLGGSGIGPGGTARRRHGDPTKNSGPMVAIGPRRFSKLQGLSSQEGLYSGSANTVSWPPRLV